MLFKNSNDNDNEKLNEILAISSKRIQILMDIKKNIEIQFEKEKDVIKKINDYFHSSCFPNQKESDRNKLQEIIQNYKINNEYTDKLIKFKITTYQTFGLEYNTENENSDDDENKKIIKLNECTLVTGTSNSIGFRYYDEKSGIDPSNGQFFNFKGKIIYFCAYKNNAILLSLNDSDSHKLKKIKNNTEITLYESSNKEITYISTSIYNNRIYFILHPDIFCVFSLTNGKKIECSKKIKVNISSIMEISEQIFFLASENSWCFYFLKDKDGQEMNYNQYNGNIFNPKDIFKLKDKYLILGGKKYIFIFNSQDFQIERKIKLNEYCSYSLITPSNDRNYICIIINNKIIVYQFLSDILNFQPIVEKNINIKVHSMIFEKEKLILFEDKLTIETMRIQQPYN
jgi:hypothetical protein